MAKKIRFPLKMKNGAEVRTLDELKENFDLESVLGYFTDGRLTTWLADRYYDEKAEAVSALSADMPELNAKLCEILEVEYEAESDETDLEYIQRRNEKLRVLSTVTTDQDILKNVDLVAMDQDELFDILDESPEKVYLYGEKFSIPLGRKNITYIGINQPSMDIKDITKYQEAGIKFKNVKFNGNSNPYVTQGEKLYLQGKYKEAFPLIKQAAENGNPRAMYILSDYLDNGYETVKINKNERDNWLVKAKDFNEPISTYAYSSNCCKDNSAEATLSKVFNEIKSLAESDDIIAQTILGEMYYYGIGIEKNADKAEDILIKAAEKGNANAKLILGRLYYNVKENSDKAVEYYRKAAEQGIAIGQALFGFMYFNGEGVSKDYKKAIELLEKSAEQDCGYALYNLAVVFRDGLAEQTPDISKAIALFKKTGEQGYSKGYLELGKLYSDGESIPKDEAKAADYYKKASELGNVNADFSLGKMYVLGNGVKQNFEEADKHFELYADRSWDCFRIGEIYEKADKSYEKALKWYTKAAEYDEPDTDALIALGRIEDTINYDYYEAVKWYQKAVNQKAKSAYEIGYLYDEGEKVPQDYSKAVEWYRKGVELEDADSYKALGNMYYYGNGVECDKEKANELCTRSIELFTKIYEETKIAVEKGEKEESDLSWAEMHLNMAKMSISSMGFEEKVKEVANFLEETFDYLKPVSIIDKYIHSCIKSGSKAYDSNEIKSVSSKVERAKNKFGYRATGNIIGLIDTSLFGNGNDGFLFTDEGLAFDYAFTKVFVRYDEITSIEYGKKCKSITLNGYFKSTNNYLPELSDIYLNLDIVKTMLEKLSNCK